MKTPSNNEYLGQDIIPKPQRGETRMRVIIGCINVEYVNESESKLTFLTSADGNIVIFIQRFLPQFLINFGTKHIMYYIMQELRTKIAEVKGSVYEERMNQKPEYYDYIQKTISEN